MRSLLKTCGFACAIAFLYLYSFPYFYPEMRHANELPRVYLVKAMVDDGTFAIDHGVRTWGETADVSEYGGHVYSNKAPGASMLAVPPYWVLEQLHRIFGDGEPSLAQTTWLCRVVTGVIPTLLFLVLLWRFLERWAPKPQTRRLVIAAYAVGSMAMPYAVLFHSHQLSAVCIATAYILIVQVLDRERSERWLIAAGFAAGCAPLVDYQAAFAGVPIAIFLLWKMLRGPTRRWRAVGFAVAGSVPPIALLLAYHAAAFGGAFHTGYSYTKYFKHHHDKGFLGMDQLRLEAFVGSTIAPDNGLFFLCPVLLLALVGWVLLARKKQWWTFTVTLSIAVFYLLFISSLSFWRGGWQVGPRYIVVVIPFLLIPIAAAVAAAEQHWYLRGACVGLAVVGIVIYALTTAEYPHFPDVQFRNPVYEVTFALIGDGRAPYNAGWAIGLRGFASLVPYLVVLAALVTWIAVPARRFMRSGLAGVALAAAVLFAYSFAPESKHPDKWRVYTCRVAGTMPDKPGVGQQGGYCGPGRGCSGTLRCLTCRPHRICVDPESK